MQFSTTVSSPQLNILWDLERVLWGVQDHPSCTWLLLESWSQSLSLAILSLPTPSSQPSFLWKKKYPSATKLDPFVPLLFQTSLVFLKSCSVPFFSCLGIFHSPLPSQINLAGQVFQLRHPLYHIWCSAKVRLLRLMTSFVLLLLLNRMGDMC